MSQWHYYNHALISNVSLYEKVDIKELYNKQLWKQKPKPLLARWTTDFDCGYETNWWYCIREAPYTTDSLSKSTKKHIRQALSKTNVKIINQREYATDIYRVYEEAVERYKNFVDTTISEKFISNLKAEKEKVYWGAFDKESNLLVAYMVIKEEDDYVNLCTAKFSTRFLNLQASTAMYHAILQYYLNDRGFRFVNSGERNIYHETNTQEYKIKTFGYKKAYCKLHIKYRREIGVIVRLLYPFRKLIAKMNLKTAKLVTGVLKMEEISRKTRNDNG